MNGTGDGPSNETTRLAQQDTVLSPRFYTTDFAAMDRLDARAVRAEWDGLIAELRADTNSGHFIRTDEFDVDLSTIAAGTAQGVPRIPGQLRDRGVLRLRALCRDQEAHQQPATSTTCSAS